jgi:hypothetical protein
MDDMQINNQNMMAMMTGTLHSPASNKKAWAWGASRGQDSLLGMTSTMFRAENLARSFRLPTPMNSNGLGLLPSFNDAAPSSSSSSPEDITTQVLAELADDSMFEPPSEDIFDMEPVPLHPNHAAQQKQKLNRLTVLEDTLNQVLSIGDMFIDEDPQTTPHQQVFGPLSTPTVSSSKRSADIRMSPSSKRQRLELEQEEEEDAARRFRPYQAEQWSEKFEELLAFRAERGHCCVPHTFDENPSLARWVKRQRYQYKLKIESKPSTMTDERIVALEQVGFVWDSHGAAWMERWNELHEFQQEHGHANVPSNYAKSPQLATWVKCQRRQYKLFNNGKATNMTLERLQRLESVGFEWELRAGSSTKNNEDTKSSNKVEAPLTMSSTPNQESLVDFRF